jgi:hypothetical protein
MPFDLTVLDCVPTAIGLICIRQRPVPGVAAGDSRSVVTEITLDNQFLMSSENTESERALSSLAVEMHGGTGLRVLVGGLGLGYTAYEALRSERVARVEVVELLAPVIDWVARGLVPLSGELDYTARAGHSFILPNVEALLEAGRSFVDAAHGEQVRVGTWVVDDEATQETMFQWGVDAVASNDPASAVATLRRFQGNG